MQHALNGIDNELLDAISNSPFSYIDYEGLLISAPHRIREEENHVQLKEEPLAVPDELEVRNISIPSSDKNRNIGLRIYRPKGQHNLPVYVFFHGGAFIYGTAAQYDFMCFKLAIEVGMLIVSVDYRLAPEHPFPAGMLDGYDVLLWLSQYADQIGGNKNNMMIGGSSAGACIAASVTLWARDRSEVQIKHQYLLYPPMSHLLNTNSMQVLAEAPMQTQAAAAWMWRHYLGDKITIPPPYAVPLLADTLDNLPDCTMVVCEFDPLKDEAILYAERLKKHNVLVNLLEVRGAVHAFDFFNCRLSDTFYKQQVQLFKNILSQ
ncbi:alpha/beta hydrolase [Sphingobacterium tabacisoli]|uniref:Alpha/beta hydrolase n=1 Tax=Sphingobacterium tabacisoli TaxID=2044855 RepID=A0ABW5L8B0_9SPHI|nr:alpha/beta hydrolase [Sphingobacterium tabacisoli]